MPPSMRLPELHVEGRNDTFAIGDLLKKHGFGMPSQDGPVIIQDHGSEEEASRGVDETLRTFEFAVQQSAESCVGFVMDADQHFGKRWDQVRSRLENLGGPAAAQDAHGRSDLADRQVQYTCRCLADAQQQESWRPRGFSSVAHS